MLYVNYYVPQLGSAERGVVITQSTTNAVNNHYRPVLTDTNTIQYKYQLRTGHMTITIVVLIMYTHRTCIAGNLHV